MMSEIKRDKRGFYTLYIDGVFEGNYDTYAEAAKACKQIIWWRSCCKGIGKRTNNVT